MRLLRAIFMSTVVMAGAAVAVGATAGPAAAHQHPTPIELDAPAVVRIQAYARVSISLIEHNRIGVHIGLLQRTYMPLLISGSGFAVDPSGGIVTSPKVIDVDLKRAEIYAVNKIFNDRYGDGAPLPADPFSTQTIRDTDPNDRASGRLQRCYQPNTTDDTGGCVVFSERVVKVLPFVSSQAQYGDLEATVLAPSAAKASDVVVLKVGASSMPTVNFASSTQGVTAFSVLGFAGTPADSRSLLKVDGHFTAAGAAQVKRDEDYAPLIAGMGSGLAGGPVVGERGQVVGFLTPRPAQPAGDGSSDLAAVGPEAIRAALSGAGINPHQGPTDGAYEAAMHNYKNKLYTPAIPSLTQTLKLYPGHALAAEALADANRKKGTAEDATGRGTPNAQPVPTRTVDFRRTILPLAVGVTAILVLLFAVALMLRRRKVAARVRAGRTGTERPVSPLPVPRQRDTDAPGAEVSRRQQTLLRSRQAFEPDPAAGPVAAARSASGLGPRGSQSGEAGTGSSRAPSRCARCGNPVVASQSYCGRCGRWLHERDG